MDSIFAENGAHTNQVFPPGFAGFSAACCCCPRDGVLPSRERCLRATSFERPELSTSSAVFPGELRYDTCATSDGVRVPGRDDGTRNTNVE